MNLGLVPLFCKTNAETEKLTKTKKNYLKASLIPITDEKIKLSFGLGKGHVNDNAIVDTNWPITTTSLVEGRGWEI